MTTSKPPEGTRTVASRALRAAARGEREPPARLQVLDGPMAGRSLPLGEEETVGRGSGASLALPDPAASRLHLRLRLGDGVVTAEDLGSKNGSLVNRRRLRRVRPLRPGDELTVGTTRLRFEAAPPAAAPPSPRPAPGTPLLAGAAVALLAAAAALLARG
ncbi:MAG: FHA domain-containing protein [Deltaproteobacteria bacterium]|nr:FHA domain-containing protein [Deltaproteobacteria bacterium]